jgi:transposase-like protein
VSAVAAEFGVAYETARRWLRNAGVELRPSGRPILDANRLDCEEIARRYRDGDSMAALGDAFGVSPGTIRARLIEAGVELRPRPGWNY